MYCGGSCPFYYVSDGCTKLHEWPCFFASFAGTFHSVGCQIVRRNVAKLGDTGRQPFAIFDQDDTKNVMKIALRKHFALKRGSAAAAAGDLEAVDDAVGEADDAVSEADGSPSKQAPLHEWVGPLQHRLLAQSVDNAYVICVRLV